MNIKSLIEKLQEIEKVNPSAEVVLKNTDPFIEDVNIFSKIQKVELPQEANSNFVTITF